MRRAWPVLVLVVMVSMNATGTGQPPALTPGPCVPIPSVSLEIHRDIRQASPPDPEYPIERSDVVGYSSQGVVDLDGDGAPEVLVPEPAAGDCVETMHLAIYLARGSCGHRIGQVVGRLDVASVGGAPRSHGLPDLTSRSVETLQDDPRTPAVQRTTVHRYRFDGLSYVEIAHSQQDSVCHHCPLQSCTTSQSGAPARP